MEIPKEERIRLTPTGYKKICQLIDRRASDNNGFLACEMCGRNGNAVVAFHHHHIRFRSAYGSDTLENLILLCDKCHAKAHGVEEKAFQKDCLERVNDDYAGFFYEMYQPEAQEIYKKYRRR